MTSALRDGAVVILPTVPTRRRTLYSDSVQLQNFARITHIIMSNYALCYHYATTYTRRTTPLTHLLNPHSPLATSVGRLPNPALSA